MQRCWDDSTVSVIGNSFVMKEMFISSWQVPYSVGYQVFSNKLRWKAASTLAKIHVVKPCASEVSLSLWNQVDADTVTSVLVQKCNQMNGQVCGRLWLPNICWSGRRQRSHPASKQLGLEPHRGKNRCNGSVLKLAHPTGEMGVGVFFCSQGECFWLWTPRSEERV